MLQFCLIEFPAMASAYLGPYLGSTWASEGDTANCLMEMTISSGATCGQMPPAAC